MTQVTLDREARVVEHDEHGPAHEILDDLAYQRLAIVNVIYFGRAGAGDHEWVLVDAGLPGTAGSIKRAARERFGESSRPAAIIMTHAHADHAGALERLAEEWNVPIYAHELELPYLNGSAAYPPPDPSVGGGLMPAMSVLFPRGPFNVARWLQTLPQDGTVPHMAGWRWIHTPGHTPGHVSLYRPSDSTLIAGDAFITTGQESVYKVMTQRAEMHGPPMYYTQNWEDSERSVQKLAALDPELVITGHGRPMHGEEMRGALHKLASDFKTVAVPEGGKYVKAPTTPEDGSAYKEPKRKRTKSR